MSPLAQAVIYSLVALPAIAQSPAFATITIKPALSANPPGARMRVLPGGNLTGSAVSVNALLSYAYDVPSNPSPRLSNLPEWALREKYDIEAKAPANAVPPGLPEGEARSRVQQMVRELLAGRFQLVLRVENRTMPVYALTIASGGPRLQKSPIAGKGCAFQTGPDACHNFVGGLGHPLNAKAIDMDDLAHYIANWTGLPVVNRSALSGLFTVNTEGWVPMRLPPPPPNTTATAVNPFAGLPTIFDVLRKLGLELKRQQDTLSVYTVEHIERPAAN
ncbi:TIGR03435 family protein [Paludibaculum fermentans]|uniref:TIGR03435 family protein n=1 Tax=Paludibaculum fermentans TaxID=1473598 RepID=A0A7S7SJ70_PALFE|nr:TIGR03435 family protein [Paludibaculum fermentans]QOY87772.1 TIGR03435 family protein [Paludibaculum fermentans]